MTVAKVSLSLPKDLLRAVERWRRATGETRSEFVRRALLESLERREREDEIERYIRGYEIEPESSDEVDEVATPGLVVLAEDPWE